MFSLEINGYVCQDLFCSQTYLMSYVGHKFQRCAILKSLTKTVVVFFCDGKLIVSGRDFYSV